MSEAVATPDDERVGDARARYFAASGFPADGGYDARWVTLQRVGPLALGFPNWEARRRTVRLHDLHHVATGYATTWTGEAEIAAWEMGGSCRHHWVAWLLNAGAMPLGLWFAPRRVFRAFVRGRHTRNLYAGGFREALLGESVGVLRERLGLGAERPAEATAGDVLAFVACVAASSAFWLAALAAPVGLAWALLFD